jgi:hypothetical protein
MTFTSTHFKAFYTHFEHFVQVQYQLGHFIALSSFCNIERSLHEGIDERPFDFLI